MNAPPPQPARDKVVNVPKIHHIEKPVFKTVPKEVVVNVEKAVAVPGTKTCEVFNERVVIKEVKVPIERTVERIVQIPVHTPIERVIEKVIEVPVDKYVDKVVTRVVEKIVERPYTKVVKVRKMVPVERVVERKVEIPFEKHVIKRVEVPFDRIVERLVEVPVEKVIEKRIEITMDRVEERVVHIPYDVVRETVVEVQVDEEIAMVQVPELVQRVEAPRRITLEQQGYVPPRANSLVLSGERRDRHIYAPKEDVVVVHEEPPPIFVHERYPELTVYHGREEVVVVPPDGAHYQNRVSYDSGHRVISSEAVHSRPPLISNGRRMSIADSNIIRRTGTGTTSRSSSPLQRRLSMPA